MSWMFNILFFIIFVMLWHFDLMQYFNIVGFIFLNYCICYRLQLRGRLNEKNSNDCVVSNWIYYCLCQNDFAIYFPVFMSWIHDFKRLKNIVKPKDDLKKILTKHPCVLQFHFEDKELYKCFFFNHKKEWLATLS